MNSKLMKYFQFKTLLIKKILTLSLLITFGCDNGTAQRQSSSKSSAASKPVLKNKKQENTIIAPDFTLADLEGNLVSMNQFQGKVVLLNFWGTWCGPCKREIPDFINLIDKHGTNGLEIVGITLSSGSPKDIKKFANKRKINYTLLTDINGNETQRVKALYGQETGEEIEGIPTTFLIDKDGNIRKRYVGPRSEEVFFTDLEPYI